MSQLIKLIQALIPKSQSQLDDDYLAQAADIYDLELRMGELHGRVRPRTLGLALAGSGR